MTQCNDGPAYIYVLQPDDMQIWKTGITQNPLTRLQGLQSMTPHRMRYIRMLLVQSFHHAGAFERYALTWLAPVWSHGEWHTCLDAINAQLDEVCPAVDVTDEFADMQAGLTRRRLAASYDLGELLAQADEKAEASKRWARRDAA